jgi:uncharacterized membrane protein
MKTLRAPSLILGFLYLCFVGYLVYSAALLPERVATHFNAQGQPDGWMSRSSHLAFTTLFGFAFPLFLVTLFYVIRFLPPQGLNIPHRDYWLAPERRLETFDYLFGHSMWLAGATLGLLLGIQFLIVQANTQGRAHLSMPTILGFLSCFLTAVVVWVATMFLHFRFPVTR